MARYFYRSRRDVDRSLPGRSVSWLRHQPILSWQCFVPPRLAPDRVRRCDALQFHRDPDAHPAGRRGFDYAHIDGCRPGVGCRPSRSPFLTRRHVTNVRFSQLFYAYFDAFRCRVSRMGVICRRRNLGTDGFNQCCEREPSRRTSIPEIL